MSSSDASERVSVAKTSALLVTPSPSVEIIPRTYSEEEQEKIKALREYAETLKLPEEDPYYPHESQWLADPACAERYMRAAKWKLDDAKKRIAGTLAWRREYKPDLIPPEEVRIESETGKIILNGFDINGRPIITMHPGRENTKPSDRQLRHLVYVLERAIDLMPTGQDSLVIIVDYRSTTLRTNPSISVAAKVLTILQNHYPERLGRAIVVNLPFILQFFYKGISPFLDPVTKEKMRFNPDLKELVPDDHLDVQFGGSYNYEFEPTVYWDTLKS
ncbi:CRAL/TRIO domain-containing protein [Serendipita vermifera]|nr:CRAL/TRIO domain-containing protein [Serendipita vermifera]